MIHGGNDILSFLIRQIFLIKIEYLFAENSFKFRDIVLQYWADLDVNKEVTVYDHIDIKQR